MSTSAPPLAREFQFDSSDFARVRALIRERAGIDLHARKEALVYGRLARRLCETGHRSCTSYLDWLEAASGDAGTPEWQEFINCLTTNLTAFFREPHHFETLAAALLERAGQAVRIWCSAASTGEEPYSVAMTVMETLGPDAGTRILASDIDTRVLAAAERAIYDADAPGLGRERLRAHCMRGRGAMSGSLRIRSDVARLVEFQPFNLTQDRWSFAEPFDIVFCRNVMIYFDAPVKARVMRRLHAAMKQGGLLFLGHADHAAGTQDLFRLRGKTVYERV